MKTIKILTTALLLFLAASVNMAWAQNDSIYNLEVSIKDNVMDLSFYSTYVKLVQKTSWIYIDVLEKGTETKLGTVKIEHYFAPKYNIDTLSFSPRYGDGKGTYVEVQDSIYKISLEDRSLDDVMQNKDLKLNVYLEGEGYVPSTSNLRSTSAIGRSNVLTYFYSSQSVGINEVTQSKEIEDTQFFNLQGVEVGVAPIGIPYVELQTDINGKKSVIKKLIQQ